MTREEEIKNEAKLKCYDIAGEVDYMPSAAYDGFVMGAEWADKTMIEKARKWLFNNTYKHPDDSRVSMCFEYTIDMFDNFRKAMEE